MTDADAIARFIAERGVTRCPTVFMWPSQAARDLRGTVGDTRQRSGNRWGRGAGTSGQQHRTVARIKRRLTEIKANEEAGR